MICNTRKWVKVKIGVVTLWQLSQCYNVFALKWCFFPKIPKDLYSIVSLSISLQPMVRKMNKNGHFILEILVFNSQTKNVQNAIFQFSTWFLKTFPSTEMGPLYLKKNCKPSSARIYHNQPSSPTHGLVIALAKCIQCAWTVGKYKAMVLSIQCSVIANKVS